jgi:hypothetical protein
MPQFSGGREMTVGDVFSTILSTKKVEQFKVLKADVLARRFFRADLVDAMRTITAAYLKSLITTINSFLSSSPMPSALYSKQKKVLKK